MIRHFKRNINTMMTLLLEVRIMFQLLVIGCFFTCAYGRASPLPLAQQLPWDGKIIGGRDATIEEHPYQLSFQVVDQHTCGAALIAPNIAVTAAHCTEGLTPYIKYLSVRAGSTIRENGGQFANVSSIHDHPKFDPENSKDYDVSVLVLKQSFALNAGVQLIPLQPVNTEVPTGVFARVSGWGYVSGKGPLSKILQAVDVPKVDQNVCKIRYPVETVSERMHCFGYEKDGKDTCQGDSGGPLVANGKLIGVVSWGYVCGDATHPGVFTKVANADISNHINSVVTKFRKP